jgi:hypothetical protein
LTGSRGRIDFLFYCLGDNGYLFVPADMVPAGGTTFLDVPASKYGAYKNTLRLPLNDSAPVSAGIGKRMSDSLR